MSIGCAISSERDDAALDAGRSEDAPALDVPAHDAPDAVMIVDTGADAGPPERPLRHLLLLYWPFGLVDWAPERTADGFSLGPAMAALPTEDLALITDLRAAPPADLMDTHADVPPALWTGGAERFGTSIDVTAAHPSLDAVVADEMEELPLVTRSSTRAPGPYAPATSFAAARVPSTLTLDADSASSTVPCAEVAFPTLDDGSSMTFEEVATVVEAQIRFVIDGFDHGCLHAAGLQIGDPRMVFEGDRVGDLMHESEPSRVAPVVVAFSRWLAGVIASLAAAGALDDTLVVLTTQQGGELPLAHSFSDLPVFLWSRAATFRPGWIDGDGRPLRDWLHTVALAFGRERPFAAPGQPPGVPIDGLFGE